MGSGVAVWRRVCALAVVLAWAVGFAPAAAETGAKADTPASPPAAATALAQPGDAAGDNAAPAARAGPPGDAGAPAEGVLLATHSASGIVAVRSWKRLRDERIVKQDLDHSCGAASLATLLNAHFGQQLTEAQLLDAMGRGDAMVSFEDMARALPGFGFRAQGFAANFEQLMRLRQPVIVYVRHRRQSHFSVLRGIDAHQPMQLAVMSAQEMTETEGAKLNFVVGGLAGGGIQGGGFIHGALRGHHQWNTGRFLANVGTGAAFGATTGQLRFLASGVSGFRNLATPGGAIWAFNNTVGNWGFNHVWRRP